MIKRQSSYVARPQGIRYIPAPSKPSVITTGKKHDFPYRDEKEKEIKLQRNMSEVNTVKREFKLMANIGFVKKNDNTLYPYAHAHISYKLKPSPPQNKRTH